MTKLMKPVEVAAVLNVTDREVRMLCEQGIIRAGKIRNVWRVHPEDLDAYVQRLRGLTAPAEVKTSLKKGHVA